MKESLRAACRALGVTMPPRGSAVGGTWQNGKGDSLTCQRFLEPYPSALSFRAPVGQSVLPRGYVAVKSTGVRPRHCMFKS
jgi:hypothetical protein